MLKRGLTDLSFQRLQKYAKDEDYFSGTWSVVIESDAGDEVVYEGDFETSKSVMQETIEKSMFGHLPNADVKWYHDGVDVGGGNLLRGVPTSGIKWPLPSKD